MKSKRESFILWFLLIWGLVSAQTMFPAVVSQSTTTTTTDLPIEFTGQVTKDFNFNTGLDTKNLSIGNLNNINLTNLSPPGTTTYAFDDLIIGHTETFYQVTVDLIGLFVLDDKDSIGAGEIFLDGQINGNQTRIPHNGSTFSIDSNENVSLQINLFSSKAKLLDIQLEVLDDDGVFDDSLGILSFISTTLTNTTFSVMTDTGDAEAYFNVTLTSETTDLTAGELLQSFRPYLYIDDETANTELPDQVLGRVILGEDQGQEVLVLQYYFYWLAEFSPDGGIFSFELHKNDYEALLVYFELANLTAPYRIVFNNYIYTDLLSFDPGFPSEDLLILEKGAIETTKNYNSSISSNLQPLLGVTATQEATIKPMTSLKNWEYNTILNFKKDVRRRSLLGLESFELTVDTSYHSFDLGPGSDEYGYNYSIQELNQSVLEDWYSEVEQTLINGTHLWSYVGIDVPIVGPFTHDVTQVFTEPYLISGYKNVIEEAGAITRAQNSALSLNQTISAGINFQFPGIIRVEYPSTLTAGITSDFNFSLIINPEEVYLDLVLDMTLKAALIYWFIDANYTLTADAVLRMDLAKGSVESFLEKLGLNELSLEDISVPISYVNLDELILHPTIFGTIASGSISLDLWELAKAQLVANLPGLTNLIKDIDFFIDAINIVAEPQVQAIVFTNLTTDVSDVALSSPDVKFQEQDEKVTVEVTIPSDFDRDSLSIDLTDVSYSLNLEVDWAIQIAFETPINLFISDFTVNLGTFPNYVAQLFTSPGTTLVIPVNPADTFPIELLLGGLVFGVVVVYIIYRRVFK